MVDLLTFIVNGVLFGWSFLIILMIINHHMNMKRNKALREERAFRQAAEDARRDAAYEAWRRQEAVMNYIKQKQRKDTVTWYQYLEVPENATELEIQRAYKKKAMVMHPDKGGTVSQMANLNKAREIGMKYLKLKAR